MFKNEKNSPFIHYLWLYITLIGCKHIIDSLDRLGLKIAFYPGLMYESKSISFTSITSCQIQLHWFLDCMSVQVNTRTKVAFITVHSNPFFSDQIVPPVLFSACFRFPSNGSCRGQWGAFNPPLLYTSSPPMVIIFNSWSYATHIKPYHSFSFLPFCPSPRVSTFQLLLLAEN